MDKTRLWIIGCILAMAAIGGLGWVLGVQPQLDAATAADTQTAGVNGTNAANAAVLARLQKDSKGLPALKETLAGLAVSVPPAADTPAFADELNGFAASAGVTISGWQIQDAQAYKAPADPHAAASTAAGSGASASTSTSTPTPSPSATPAPTATAAPTPSAGMPPAPSALLEGAQFALVPVSVTVHGPYPNVLAFLDAAQKGGRLFLVNGLDVSPAAEGDGFDGKVSGFVYVLATTDPAAPASK